VIVNGTRLRPDSSGALYWPDGRALLVADLHLEKGSAFAARGVMLPPYDTRATLARLAEAVGRYRPALVACLGDSFHDGGADQRLSPWEVDEIRRLTGLAEWIWIAGNHDPAPPDGLGGRIEREWRLGPLTLRHEPRPGAAAGEMAGHLHPKAAVSARGKRLVRRCFATDGVRLVMPAFGAYAGGLDVLDAAFRPLFAGRFQAHLLGRDEVYPVSSERLVAIAG
jgi:uncharacterized protein